MFKGVVITIIIFAGGDFAGGGEADVAVVPSLVEAGGAGFVDIERLIHRAASPGLRKAINEAVFVSVSAEPLPIGVLSVGVGIKAGTIARVNEVASVAGLVIAGAGGGAETATGGAVGAEARAGSEGVAGVSSLVGIIEIIKMLSGFGVEIRGTVAARFGDIISGGEIDELFLALGDVAGVNGEIRIDKSEGAPGGGAV